MYIKLQHFLLKFEVHLVKIFIYFKIILQVLGAPKLVLFRLKRFLLEALIVCFKQIFLDTKKFCGEMSLNAPPWVPAWANVLSNDPNITNLVDDAPWPRLCVDHPRDLNVLYMNKDFICKSEASTAIYRSLQSLQWKNYAWVSNVLGKWRTNLLMTWRYCARQANARCP